MSSMAFQGDSIYWVEIEKIVPNPFQPRREFDENKLKELAESIRMYGILQPITVTKREIETDDGAFTSEYELIAGERRLRASKIAGLSQMPVIIRSGEDTEQEKLELAIIENLQREDLSAVDRALAFKQLAEQFKLSHTDVAKKVGRSREYVSNSIRLLQLPETILSALSRGDMTEGHARTLLMLNDRPEEQDVVFRETLLKKLSVREVEKIARKIATDKVRKKDWGMDPELIEIEKKFTDTLGTRVQISKTDFGGRLVIDYFSNEDLNKLLSMVGTGGMITANNHKEPMQAVDVIAEHTVLESVETETVIHPEEPNNNIENTPEEQVVEENVHHSIEPKEEVVSHNIPSVAFGTIADREDGNNIQENISHENTSEQSDPESISLVEPKKDFSTDIHREEKTDNISQDVNEPNSSQVIEKDSLQTFNENLKKENESDESDLYSINNFSL